MEIYIIIGAIILAVVLILAALVFLKNYKIKKDGKDGEKKVANELKKYAVIRSYKVINDLHLPLYDKSTQIDHILIGFFGLLVIETKSVSGEIYGDPKKKEWSAIAAKTGKKRELYNPLMQNQTHIDCIRHHLGLQNIYNVNIESLIVFPTKKVQLNVPKKLPVVNFKQFKKYIRQPRFEKDANYDVEKLYNTLMSCQTINDSNKKA